MTKEIENLQQMSTRRDVFRSLASKRERQYGQIGQHAKQESLAKTVRIGEIMDRTLDRWQNLTQNAEELDQNITAETERVRGLIHRLDELGSRNPAIRLAYEEYKTEFDDLQNSQIPTLEETIQEPTVETYRKGEISPLIPKEIVPQPTVEAHIEDEARAVAFPGGQTLETGKIIPAKILEKIIKGDSTIGEISVVIYGKDNKDNRNRVSAQVFHARKLAETNGWTIEKTTIGEGRGKVTVFGLKRFEAEQVTVEESQPGQEVPTSSESQILQIPEIPELRRIESANQHKYDETLTVKYSLEHAQSTDPTNRTEEQQQLLEDVEYLKRYTSSIYYQGVYSPEELHGLVSKLRHLEGKNRESFNEVEGRLIDHLIKIERSNSAKYESPKRTHSPWTTLKRNANRVVSYLRTQYAHQPEKKAYFIALKDPQPEKGPRDLSLLYTFVAYDNAINLIGKRTVEVSDQRVENFFANCEVINRWYESVKPSIDRIPNLLRLPTGYSRQQRMVGARWLLCDLVETMNTRLNGNAFDGFDKSYKYDVAGAINLQHKIKHCVEEINGMLKSITTEEIVPLEPNS